MLVTALSMPHDFVRDAGDSGSDTVPNKVRDGTPERTLIAELNQVVLAACESDCRLRYPSAQAMHDDLALLKTGRSIKRKRAFGRRWKLAKTIVLTGMAVAVAGAFDDELAAAHIAPPFEMLELEMRMGGQPSAFHAGGADRGSVLQRAATIAAV